MLTHDFLQRGAEGIMRNVAKRMLNGELCERLLSWRNKFAEAKNQARGERIMKRVAGRWMNRTLSDAVTEWHEKQQEEQINIDVGMTTHAFIRRRHLSESVR